MGKQKQPSNVFGYLIHNYLGEVMRERGINAIQLARMSGVGVNKIGRLKRGDCQRIDIMTLIRICIALGVQISDLFVVHLDHLWTEAKIRGVVNAHMVSSICSECTATSTSGPHGGSRESYGRFDNVAENHVFEHVSTLKGVIYRRHLHTNPEGPFTAYESKQKHWLVDGGFHVIFGSPASNELSEDFVSRECYGVPPHSPHYNHHFPYIFVWPRGKVVSSFGCDGDRQECGIIDTSTGELVAQRTFDADGRLDLDCALIVAYRPPPDRFVPGQPQRDGGLVIMCLGHSGPATYACAKLITDPIHSAELYPTEVGKPVMRVVSAVTLKPEGGGGRNDARELVKWKLLEDAEFTTPQTWSLASAAVAS